MTQTHNGCRCGGAATPDGMVQALVFVTRRIQRGLYRIGPLVNVPVPLAAWPHMEAAERQVRAGQNFLSRWGDAHKRVFSRFKAVRQADGLVGFARRDEDNGLLELEAAWKPSTERLRSERVSAN